MKILFFSPNSAIWRHLSAEIQISMELVAENHEVTFLNCERNFADFCVSMSAFGLTYDSSEEAKQKICKRCIKTTEYANQIQFFDNVSIPNLQQYDDRVLQAISEVTSTNWHQFEFGGIPIGRMAAYEFYLNNKIASLVIPEALFSAYLSSLRYSMSILLFSEDYLRNNSFDSVIVYNRIYSLNNVFCRVAENLGIPTYTLHAAGPINDHYSRFSFYKRDLQALTINTSNAWTSVRNLAIDEQESKLVVDHFRGLLSAKSPWVYSSKFKGLPESDLLMLLKVPEGSRILLLTTSSVDEIFAIKLIGIDPIRPYFSELFDSQLDWIKSVCEYVSNQNDLFLIIRIHPREFPNKRESVESNNGKAIIEMLREISASNIYVNLPEDNLSLYDLAQITNLLLSGNSSAGAELAALKIPVLCHERRNLTAFPEDLAFWAESQKEYFELIPKLLKSGATTTQAVSATRWFSFKGLRVSRPTKLSSQDFLLLVESFVRKPVVKYGLKLPKLFIRLIYWILFDSLNPKEKSEFGQVLTQKLDGFHELPRSPIVYSQKVHELDAVSEIKNLFIG